MHCAGCRDSARRCARIQCRASTAARSAHGDSSVRVSAARGVCAGNSVVQRLEALAGSHAELYTNLHALAAELSAVIARSASSCVAVGTATLPTVDNDSTSASINSEDTDTRKAAQGWCTACTADAFA